MLSIVNYPLSIQNMDYKKENQKNQSRSFNSFNNQNSSKPIYQRYVDNRPEMQEAAQLYAAVQRETIESYRNNNLKVIQQVQTRGGKKTALVVKIKKRLNKFKDKKRPNTSNKHSQREYAKKKAFALKVLNLSDSKFDEFASAVVKGNNPRITGTNSQIIGVNGGEDFKFKHNVNFSGGGLMGRVNNDSQNTKNTHGKVLIKSAEYKLISNSSGISTNLNHAVKKGDVGRNRKNADNDLNKILGANGARNTQIDNAENLHMIGFQYGGKNTSSNLIAGSHPLNTAMIPVENMIADLYKEGFSPVVDVEAKCKYVKSTIPWVIAVKMRITSTQKKKSRENTIYLKEPTMNGIFITEDNMEDVKDKVTEMFNNLRFSN